MSDPSTSCSVETVCSWFSRWNHKERDYFIRIVLLPKVVPHKLFAQCSSLNLSEKLEETGDSVSSFQHQLVVFENTFAMWDVETRNRLCHMLEEIDPVVMNSFSELIAQTVGEP